MELTQQIRAGAAGAVENDVARKGMDEKSAEFRDKGGAIYLKQE
jgi:hypothetical protein